MYAEEVDLCDLDLLATDGDRCRDAADGCDEFARLGRADSNVPVFGPTWRFQCPWHVSKLIEQGQKDAHQFRKEVE